MCGIIGGVTQRNITPILLTGLQCLEYRGYDSAGLATIGQGKIHRIREVGKVENLAKAIQLNPMTGAVGIAHTRWATHGKPSENNAHPHMSHETLAVVHNGIIENYVELKKALETQGYQFRSETDTEVIVHLLHSWREKTDLLTAVKNTIQQLKGAYALGIIDVNMPEQLIAVRKGSPLIIGVGIEENFIASDHLALLPVTQKFIFLEEGDVATISQKSIVIYNAEGKPVIRKIQQSALSHQQAEKGAYRHYMLKEIFEQPIALANTLQNRIVNEQIVIEEFGENAATLLPQVKRITIVACGTSYHAGMVARYWLEKIAKITCQVEIASEFRYRDNVVEDNTLLVCLSQSGETADTLEALRKAKQSGYLSTLSICNVAESSLVRESALRLITKAGPEIGVASTKAFTTQLLALLLLTTALVQTKGESTGFLVEILRQLPAKAEATLSVAEKIKKLSESFANKNHTLFLGRGELYPIALEGALKLKEISYIHAEAYPAGELKHGPLALVDEDMPVVAIAPNNELIEKLLSNLQEVKARGAELILFADHQSKIVTDDSIASILIPEVNALLTPIIFTIPLQLLAYYVAIIKGTDVDQPRNLAKSVTVE
jgi:glucosamine--fructose-6-phosphate aminotransferase (isomerizing)